MGQYYKPAIIDANGTIVTLYSHDFDSGSKLTEHSWIGNEFVCAAYSLIHKTRKHVAWIGDYANDPYIGTDDAYAQAMPYDAFMKYYAAAWGKDEDKHLRSAKKFSKKALNLLDYDTTGMYLINHDRFEYIDIAEYIKNSSVPDEENLPWCLNPLPLLTACGNGRGGGDFYSTHTGYENIGIWAFASVEYTDQMPEGYTKRNFSFMEDNANKKERSA